MKQVFNEQKLNPLKGDWVTIVEKDFRKLKIYLTHEEITCMSKNGFKKVVKKHVEETGLKFLKGHKKLKGKYILHTQIKMRNYLTSNSLLKIQEKKRHSR